MSRRWLAGIGWVLVVGAVLCGLLTVPVWNARGSGTDGSVTINSSPLQTTVSGSGEFTHEAFWSVSWFAAVLCGLAFAGGVWLIYRHPGAAPGGGSQTPSAAPDRRGVTAF